MTNQPFTTIHNHHLFRFGIGIVGTVVLPLSLLHSFICSNGNVWIVVMGL